MPPTVNEKPVPIPTPETQPYWDGAAAGQLRIQRCRDCGQAYFYPRPVCPHCGSGEVEWFTTSGRGRLHSYVISERPAQGFDPPYVIAIVELDEGPRLMSSLVEIDPDPAQLTLDMPLAVRFEQRGEVAIPVFAPMAGS